MIVPTYDRPGRLAACLYGLSQLDYPSELLQIVVVDDGSPSPVAAAGAEAAVAFAVVRQPRAGPAAARNAGAQLADGELFAFIDDDCVPRRDWLLRLAERFRAGSEEGVGGRTHNALDGSPWATAAQLVIDVGCRQSRADPATSWFTTNNLAVSAEGFQAIGGFDPSYRTSEDREFCARWTASGRRLAYEPRAEVEHAHELGAATFFKLHFDYGRGAYRFHSHQRERRRSVAIEGSYYLSLVREPFRRAGMAGALVLEAVLAVWHVANTCGFLWEWSRSPRRRSE